MPVGRYLRPPSQACRPGAYGHRDWQARVCQLPGHGVHSGWPSSVTTLRRRSASDKIIDLITYWQSTSIFLNRDTLLTGRSSLGNLRPGERGS
jgi:hypothetical protein